ncbi:MAG TPA: transcriptional regulator [Clostridiales bacterium]|nr:transcriptional regulator [Clostridiales bacterium]
MISKLSDMSVEDLKKGYWHDKEKDSYVCHVCGEKFENGVIYDVGEKFYSADKMIDIHIQQKHESMLKVLISQDKKYTGLTESQKEFLEMMYLGLSDDEVAKKTNVAPVTVRQKRFVFKEKAKQAKVYLSIYELVKENAQKNKKGKNEKDQLIEIHPGATMVDERYLITEAEKEKILHTAFYSLDPLRLKNFPVKEKKKLAILQKIASQFEPDRRYTEKEVNAILKDIYDDYVTIRRYMIEYGFMDRMRDCSEYWLK